MENEEVHWINFDAIQHANTLCNRLGLDTIGLCKLEGIALKPLLPKHFQSMIVAAIGWDVSLQDLVGIGERIWNIERLFNVREGKRKPGDYPPNRLLEEPISSGPAQGERLDREKFEQMLATYYLLRDWDSETGIPKQLKLHELGLSFDA